MQTEKAVPSLPVSISPTTTTTTSTLRHGHQPILTMDPLARPHRENYHRHGELIRDSIIGFSDGLTVPFALTAALTSLDSSRLVIIGGLAELFAGSISMGLGAFLASVTELKHLHVEQKRERLAVRSSPKAEEEEVLRIFEEYGVERSESRPVVEALRKNEEMFVQFIMDFELKLGRPAMKKAWIEGLVMGVSYLIGGLLPMLPYFILRHAVHTALLISIGLTGLILLLFGYTKARLTGTDYRDAFWSAVQTLCIGAIAAGTSYGIVKAVNMAQDV